MNVYTLQIDGDGEYREPQVLGHFSTQKAADAARTLFLTAADKIHDIQANRGDRRALDDLVYAAAKAKFGYDRLNEGPPKPTPIRPTTEAQPNETAQEWANRWGPVFGQIQAQIDQRKEAEREYDAFVREEFQRVMAEFVPEISQIQTRFGIDPRELYLKPEFLSVSVHRLDP